MIAAQPSLSAKIIENIRYPENEFFLCEQYANPVRMLRSACIKRQKRAAEPLNDPQHLMFEKCIDCIQGQQIWEASMEEGNRPETKKCRTCEEVKPLSEFPTNHTHKGSKESQCKACKQEYMRSWAAKKREKAAGVKKPGNSHDSKKDCKSEDLPPPPPPPARSVTGGLPRWKPSPKSILGPDDIQKPQMIYSMMTEREYLSRRITQLATAIQVIVKQGDDATAEHLAYCDELVRRSRDLIELEGVAS